MYNKATFAKQFKLLLDRHGMTQKMMADRMNTTEATISRYVSGDRTPNIETAVDLAAALGVSLNDLVGIDPPHVKRDPEIDILTDCYKQASGPVRQTVLSALKIDATPEQKLALDNLLSRSTQRKPEAV